MMGPHRGWGRPPMMGQGPMGPRPGMGQSPMMGPHRGMGRPPMMGQRPMGPRPGMGHSPMMGPHRGMGRPPMMGRPDGTASWTDGAPGMPGARGPWGQPAWGMHRGPMPGHAAAILGRLQAADKDKDGKLSKSKAPERLQQHFDKIDANKDGQLDKAELGKALAAHGKQLRESMEKRRAEMIKRMHEAHGKRTTRAHDKIAHDKDAAQRSTPKPRSTLNRKSRSTRRS